MSRVVTNIASVLASLAGVPGVLDLDGPGLGGGPLGVDLMDVTATLVRDNTVGRQLEPGGAPLAPLAPATVARKRALGYPDRVLVETWGMTAPPELAGTRAVTPHRAVMTYGVTPGGQQKAEWAAEGSRRFRRPPRPFYEIPDRDLPALDAVVDAAGDRNVDNL